MPFNRPIPEKQRPKFSNGVNVLVQAEKMVQIALILPSAAFIGWLAGTWADSLVHQKWIGLAGIVFGGISGLFYVIRLAMNTEKDPKNADDTDSETKPGNGTEKGSKDQDHD
jgi:F0F1-type ATP synthase assembly protein I